MTRAEVLRSWARANGREVFVRLLRAKRWNEANGTHGIAARDVPCRIVEQAKPAAFESGQSDKLNHERIEGQDRRREARQ